jgi:hypothetical protein
MTKPNLDPDHDDYANDNEHGRPIAPAPSEGALVALAALGKTLNAVDTTSVIGGGGMPMLSFKREGTWMFGQKRTIVEEGSRWAVNPLTFKWGFICFDGANKVIGERLVPVSQPKPEVAELPDKGFTWHEQWAVALKCIDGTDAGTETVYKPTTNGGLQAIAGLIEAVRDRLNGGEHDGKVVPIVQLRKDSYQKPPYGRIWKPLLPVTGWMHLGGPAPAPTPASPPPAEQPRRRRVA